MVVTKRPRWAETPSSARASAPSTSPRNSASPDSVAAKPRRTPRAQRSRRDTGPHASHAGDQATSFDVAVFSLVSAICCSTSRAYTSSASFGLSVSLSVGSCSHCGAGQPCRCAAAHAAGRRSPAAGCRPSPAKSFPANGHFGLRRRKPRCQGRRRLTAFSQLSALEQPSFIWGASCLPKDEYETWLSTVKPMFAMPTGSLFLKWSQMQRERLVGKLDSTTDDHQE